MIGLFTRNDRAAGRHAHAYSLEMEDLVGLYEYVPRHRAEVTADGRRFELERVTG